MKKIMLSLSILFLLISFSVSYAASASSFNMKDKSDEEQIAAINDLLDEILSPTKPYIDQKKLIDHTGTMQLSSIFNDVDTSIVIGFYEHESHLVRAAVNYVLKKRRDKATEAINHALETGSPRVRFQILCLQNKGYNYYYTPTAEMYALLDTIIHDENIPLFITDHAFANSQIRKTEDWPFDIIGYCNRLLDSGLTKNRDMAIGVLLRSCDDISGSIDRLFPMLKNPDKTDEDNSTLIKLLQLIRRDKETAIKAIPIYNKYLKHEDKSVQLMASRMLYLLDYEPDKQVRFIIDKFMEEQTRDTFTAVSAIRKDADELLPLVEELIKSDDKFVRSQARYLYISLGGGAEVLLDMMKKNLLSSNPTVYLDAVSYFRDKRDDDITSFLLEILQTKDINNDLKYELCAILIYKKEYFKSVLPSVVELLNVSNPKDISIKAANLLRYEGGWGETLDVSSAIPALLSMMETEDSAAIKEVREVILKIVDDHEIVVNKLIELLKSDNDKIVLNAISQLGYMKEKSINSIGVLADISNSDNETIKNNSILAIRSILYPLKHNQKVTKEDILKVMLLNDSGINDIATKELINRFGDPGNNDSVIADLLLQAENSDNKARSSIFKTIGNMGNKALFALPALRKYTLLDGKTYNSPSYTAIKRIVASVYPSTEIDIPTFLSLLEIQNSDLAKDVIGVLISHDCDYEVITGKLVEIMQNEDSKFRENAVTQLGHLGRNGVSALPALGEMHKSDNHSLKRKALDSIRLIIYWYGIDEKVTIPFLITMLESNDKDYCNAAVSIFGPWNSGSTAALPALMELLENNNRSSEDYGYNKVKKTAVISAIFSMLMRIDTKTDLDPEILLDLIAMTDGKHFNTIIRKAILLSDNNKKVIEKLIELIEHGNDDIRSAAISAFSINAEELLDAVPALNKLFNRLDDDNARKKISQLITYIENRNEKKANR